MAHHRHNDPDDSYDTVACVIAVCGFFSLVIGGFAAWVTHIVWLLQKLGADAGVTFGQILLGLLGLFVPPVGVVHGVMIWAGMT